MGRRVQVSEYLRQVRSQYESGRATEHSYRPALYALFQSIDPALTVVNEPKKSEAGMPDFLFERDGVPLGWAEAKDIDKDVIKLKGYSIEQRKRYEAAFPNLIYTNGVDFEFIRDGKQIHFVSIADFSTDLEPIPERFDELERQLRLFAEQKPISIRSAARLAEMMAAKAAIIKDEIGIALDGDPDYRSGLGGQFRSFKANLLPNLTPGEFADIYAETITYGMFAARFHDDDLSTFSRQEALEKLPASNPFLKGLFGYIAGPALPKRLEYIVDDLAQVLRASDPHSLFKDFGKFTARNDPFIHFYEDFLAAYNPAKRKSRGVWYTPEPVVDFIVRAVDDVLKTEFGLADGLADTSKVTIDWDTGQDNPKTGKPRTERRAVHKVQILDPATGTGTFLAKAVLLISERVKARAPGKWSSYVEQDLLPRLHGFELLMASYAMCHMKLDLQLTESGYRPSVQPPRLSVWLTNALEPAEREVRDLFFQPLADEAVGASDVKRQTPIMCVIGNPPYSGISQNMGEWITSLIENYKYVDGKHFGERKHWLHDDYVKFIRMAEHTIAKNGAGGVFGFITNHGYLDNTTFRGMRWHLLKTFDKIWVVDLHGNAKKNETSPDGSPDQNIFDIQQGVALILAVRHQAKSTGLGKVWRGDLWGTRDAKNSALWDLTRNSEIFSPVDVRQPQFSFTLGDHRQSSNYEKGFALKELLGAGTMGVQTSRDKLAIDFSRQSQAEKMAAFLDMSITDGETRAKFFGHKKPGKYLPGDSRGWNLSDARKSILADGPELGLQKILYRPFDIRWITYSPKLVDWPREQVMSNFVGRDNLSLLFPRQLSGHNYYHSFVTDKLVEMCAISSKTKEQNVVFPLYLYPREADAQRDAFATDTRVLNLNAKLYADICKTAGINPADNAQAGDDFRIASGDARPSEVKVFDYIYGVLHSPDYRREFAQFLKIDFPRIPYPSTPDVFRHVSGRGEELRRLHLMEPASVGETPYPYHGEGDDIVASSFPTFNEDRVYINDSQYFANVSPIAWNLNIGGYQPAHKWLKDRRGQTLTWDEICHYQAIVKILLETDRIMREIVLPLGREN